AKGSLVQIFDFQLLDKVFYKEMPETVQSFEWMSSKNCLLLKTQNKILLVDENHLINSITSSKLDENYSEIHLGSEDQRLIGIKSPKWYASFLTK
ncbi:MAG: hypothetical protein MHPSP_001542, partial [Paramarteilia canceri]